MNPATDTFRSLHQAGTFVMPNPWDVGSARIFESMGFPALATTSLGFAATLGKPDRTVTREELVAHVHALAAAVDVPINVDSERCGETLSDITETVGLLAEAGAAGFSIEDYNPTTKSIDPLGISTERVATAAAAARAAGLVLTARCESLFQGLGDLDDTIRRLCNYRDAGAEVVYAPGVRDVGAVKRIVDEVRVPVNVLALAAGPSVAELAEVGVRRVSSGGALARRALGAAHEAATELLTAGTSTYARSMMPVDELYDLLGH